MLAVMPLDRVYLIEKLPKTAGLSQTFTFTNSLIINIDNFYLLDRLLNCKILFSFILTISFISFNLRQNSKIYTHESIRTNKKTFKA